MPDISYPGMNGQQRADAMRRAANYAKFNKPSNHKPVKSSAGVAGAAAAGTSGIGALLLIIIMVPLLLCMAGIILSLGAEGELGTIDPKTAQVMNEAATVLMVALILIIGGVFVFFVLIIGLISYGLHLWNKKAPERESAKKQRQEEAKKRNEERSRIARKRRETLLARHQEIQANITPPEQKRVVCPSDYFSKEARINGKN